MPFYQQAIECFLDYTNNYVLVENYAQDNAITTEEAQFILEMGKRYLANSVIV